MIPGIKKRTAHACCVAVPVLWWTLDWMQRFALRFDWNVPLNLEPVRDADAVCFLFGVGVNDLPANDFELQTSVDVGFGVHVEFGKQFALEKQVSLIQERLVGNTMW